MKKSVALATAGLTLAASFAALTGSASAGAACGSRAPSDLDHSAYRTAVSSWAMYSGSSDTCPIVSDLAAGHQADYYCYTKNASGNYWTYLRDATSGAQGWVRDDHLINYGSSVPCGF